MAPTPWSSVLRLADQGEAFHIIDTETTGFHAQTNRVIELATVTLRKGRIIGRFETLINPGVVVPARITELTGITAGMLVDAPRPHEACRRWLDYLEGTGHFVAHNAGFDWGFLTTEFERQGLTWPFQQSFCTVELARKCLPSLPRHKLETLIEHFGIQVSDRHRALADVEATAEVFLRCLDQLRGPMSPGLEHRVPAKADTQADGWDELLAYVRRRSNPTAALLAQHAGIIGREPDGALRLSITAVYKDRLDKEERKRQLVDEAVRAVFGPEACWRLEVRP